MGEVHMYTPKPKTKTVLLVLVVLVPVPVPVPVLAAPVTLTLTLTLTCLPSSSPVLSRPFTRITPPSEPLLSTRRAEGCRAGKSSTLTLRQPTRTRFRTRTRTRRWNLSRSSVVPRHLHLH